MEVIKSYFRYNFLAGFMRDIESLASQYEDCLLLRKLEDKNRLLRKVQTILISAQELGDEKLQIVQHLQDLIENRTRSLDNDYRNIGKNLRFHYYFNNKHFAT